MWWSGGGGGGGGGVVVKLTTLSLPTPVEVELGCDNIKFLKMEDYLNFMKIDDLIYLGEGRHNFFQ